MILFPNTRIGRTNEKPLLSGIIIENEGSALVWAYVGGVGGLRESSGAANEIFAGIALSRPLNPADMPVVERAVVPANGVVTLKAAPLNGTARILDVAAGTPYTQVAGAPAAATEVQVGATATITFQVGQAGKTVEVAYRRSLTVQQAVLLIGNQDIGGPAAAFMGRCGIIEEGDVYTTEYDTNVDWSAPTDLRLGANGKFTIGGSGTKVPGYVTASPSEGNAFLGIKFNTAA